VLAEFDRAIDTFEAGGTCLIDRVSECHWSVKPWKREYVFLRWQQLLA